MTDFGLARRISARARSRTPGPSWARPAYMAPEQAAGSSRTLTTSADLYSLGAILYELLCGRPPFRGENAVETLRQLQDREPIRPRAINPRADRDLETIALKCLEKDPKARYASAELLADDLDRAREGRPISARPSGRARRSWRWCRKNPAVAALAGAVVFLLAILVIPWAVAVVGPYFSGAVARVAPVAADEPAHPLPPGASGLAARRAEAPTREASARSRRRRPSGSHRHPAKDAFRQDHREGREVARGTHPRPVREERGKGIPPRRSYPRLRPHVHQHDRPPPLRPSGAEPGRRNPQREHAEPGTGPGAGGRRHGLRLQSPRRWQPPKPHRARDRGGDRRARAGRRPGRSVLSGRSGSGRIPHHRQLRQRQAHPQSHPAVPRTD